MRPWAYDFRASPRPSFRHALREGASGIGALAASIDRREPLPSPAVAEKVGRRRRYSSFRERTSLGEDERDIHVEALTKQNLNPSRRDGVLHLSRPEQPLISKSRLLS